MNEVSTEFKLQNTRKSPDLRVRLLQKLAHFWFRLSRGMTLGVRAVVLNDVDEVFLVRHTYVPGWHLPGGGVEVGETLVQALTKELREEGNIRLTAPAEWHGIFLNRHVSQRDHVAVFVVRDFVQDGPKQPDREIAEAGFFALAHLPDGTTQGTRARLHEVLDEEPLTPAW